MKPKSICIFRKILFLALKLILFQKVISKSVSNRILISAANKITSSERRLLISATKKKNTPIVDYELSFWGHMAAGATSRTIAQSLLHPADVVKTILQTQKMTGQAVSFSWPVLMRGMDVQLIFSLPHGAFSYAITEFVKEFMEKTIPWRKAGFVMDFASSALSTTLCSIISTPQMVLHDRCMAGVYPNMFQGIKTIAQTDGLRGFYQGFLPSIAEKIPSYGLTWMFFKQLQEAWTRVKGGVKPNHGENFWIGALAAAGSVSFMMPMDIVKTRLVTQTANSPNAYKGIIDCFTRIAKEEGLATFYKGLQPRLVSVVPMIGIQFGIYEVIKRKLGEHQVNKRESESVLQQIMSQEVVMCDPDDEDCIMQQSLETALDAAIDPSS
mmetsp:Transcript_41392/g.53379  ORF Transcript_41392/g.53379 Transcript_41392/m.53379 type:complete len:383 (+) Transcript_41392:63-1211(+)